jgi:integrase
VGKPVRHRGRWRIRWFDHQGRRQSEVYDDHRDAAFKLREHQQAAEEIKRGLRRPIAAPRTFAELFDYWESVRVPQKRSGLNDSSIIRKHLRPVLGPVQVREIDVAKVDDLTGKLVRLNPKTISNILTLLISMLNLAVDLEWIDRTPRIRKPKARSASSDFRYLRTEDEIRRFLRAASAEGEHVFHLYAVAIYTGMRAGELGGLSWDDVDLDKRLITVQRSFNGPTKSGDVRHVPILSPLMPLLREWRLRHPGRLVFTSAAGTMLSPSARVFQETLHRVIKGAGFPRATRSGRASRYIVFHDLRHTFASHWVIRGGDIFKLQKILGHKAIAMTMRYAHLSPAAFLGEYDRLGSDSPTQVGSVVTFSCKAETNGYPCLAIAATSSGERAIRRASQFSSRCSTALVPGIGRTMAAQPAVAH